MGDGRRRRHHLGAGHHDAGVGFLLDADEHVLHLVGRLHAVDRRIDDGVVHEQHVVLRARVPVPCVVGETLVEGGIGAERVHQRSLVVRRAPHPAVGQPRPVGDGVALADQVLARMRHAEKLVGERARTGVGRAGQHGLLLLVVQRVVEPGDASRCIAESRMGGDVLDPFAVDIDLPAVAQAFQVFLAGERPRRADHVFWLLPFHALPASKILPKTLAKTVKRSSRPPQSAVCPVSQPSAPTNRRDTMSSVSTTSSVTGHLT